jgi:hypothetical protein
MLFIPIDAQLLRIKYKTSHTKLKKFLDIDEGLKLKRAPGPGLVSSVRILFFVGFINKC